MTLSRRQVLGAAAAGAGSVAALALGQQHRRSAPSSAAGALEAPDPAQPHLLATVWATEDLDLDTPRPALRSLLEALAAAAPPSALVGLGPRLVRALGPNLPGAADLPTFRGDAALPATHRSGDLVVLLPAARPEAALAARTTIEAAVPGLRRRWTSAGRRPGPEGRNPLGFHDEVTNPTAPAELARLRVGDGPAAGATILVLRLLRLDLERFAAQPVPDQEAAIGRRRSDGAPLSGGSRTDRPDLLARAEDGRFLIPADAHIRAARSPYAHAGPMLRRSWATEDGVLFTACQRSLATFTSTQQRLDASDALMDFVTPVASGTFLLLPGPTEHRPLGGSLLA